MKKKFSILTLGCFICLAPLRPAFAQVKKQATKKQSTVKKTTKEAPVVVKTFTPPEPQRVKILTDSGIMIVRLYDSTPLHRDNFINLVKQGFYDSLLFHRVIPQFMIQGGDPTSKNAAPGTMLGSGGDSTRRVPAEFRTSLFHKRGVLAAARDNNPEKASSPSQFYLVQGKVMNDAELNAAEGRIGKKFTEQERNIYKTIGGTPWLDQNYTVFGEVESGLEVIQKIAMAPRDSNNRPLTDIRMYMELIK